MRSLATALLAALTLAGCTGARVPVGYDVLSDNYRPARSFCENYARETGRTRFENLSDSEDGFGTDVFNVRRSDRAAANAYDRCRAGRTN